MSGFPDLFDKNLIWFEIPVLFWNSNTLYTGWSALYQEQLNQWLTLSEAMHRAYTLSKYMYGLNGARSFTESFPPLIGAGPTGQINNRIQNVWIKIVGIFFFISYRLFFVTCMYLVEMEDNQISQKRKRFKSNYDSLLTI